MGGLLRVRAALNLLFFALPALAVTPELASTGWVTFGPLPPGRDPARDTVVIDPDDCGVEVARTDLDGGPYNQDVRLSRVWERGSWRWADDWRVRDGMLERPGRRPVRVGPGNRVEGTTLEVDPAGRVLARLHEGDRLEILRDASGAFRGMRRGTVWVRIEDDTRGLASDGREAHWRYDGLLAEATDSVGRKVRYITGSEGLTGVAWADGSAVTIAQGIGRSRVAGPVGTWTCALSEGGQRTVLVSPAGRWSTERTPDTRVVVDPEGATTRTLWQDGRLAGWVDPRGGTTRVGRDAEGRVNDVADPSGARWTFAWDVSGLSAVTAPDGARWEITRASGGAIVKVQDPGGRAATWERDAAGRARGVRAGPGRWAIGWDAAGRPTTVLDPGGAQTELRRDARGRVETVRDATGSVWTIGYDESGPVRVTDPAGATWAIVHDVLGRAVAVRDPAGRDARWSLRPDGTPGRVTLGQDAWELLWNAAGFLTALRDPAGQLTGWGRDALGRVRAVHRADGSTVTLDRDGAGDLQAVDDVRVRRDAAGRALGLEGSSGTVFWDRDAAGRVAGVTAPGRSVAFTREPDGALHEVRVGADASVTLQRDGRGDVVAATGERAVEIARDAVGRIVGISRSDGTVRVERDARGLPARITVGNVQFALGRDAAGRLLAVEASTDTGVALRLGVDRDPAGRPQHVRFMDGVLARFAWLDAGAAAALTDRDGKPLGAASWSVDAAGRVIGLDAGISWLFRRDPLGSLAAAESASAAWSNAPDGVEGPDHASVRYDARGRPTSARPPSRSDPWGLGGGAVRYLLGDDGAIRSLTGANGSVRVAHDGAGRLVAWAGPRGTSRVLRDALGRLVAVSTHRVNGWEGFAVVDDTPVVRVPGLAAAAPGADVLLDPRDTPLFAWPPGPLFDAPAGVVRGVADPRRSAFAGAGGRMRVTTDGPLLGLDDAVDPLSGQSTGPTTRLPWAPRPWEPAPGSSPLTSPDATSSGWDPSGWDPDSPWADPLQLLVSIGDFPNGGPRAPRAPGLPWLPASFAPTRPLPVPEPWVELAEPDPVVAWVIQAARAPAGEADPAAVAAILLGRGVAPWLTPAPGLAPTVPEEMGG